LRPSLPRNLKDVGGF